MSGIMPWTGSNSLASQTTASLAAYLKTSASRSDMAIQFIEM